MPRSPVTSLGKRFLGTWQIFSLTLVYMVFDSAFSFAQCQMPLNWCRFSDLASQKEKKLGHKYPGNTNTHRDGNGPGQPTR